MRSQTEGEALLVRDWRLPAGGLFDTGVTTKTLAERGAMDRGEESVLDRIRSVIQVTEHGAPATARLIESVEQALGVEMPQWLRNMYLACDGFCGPTYVRYLYPLEGRDSVRDFTLFVRSEWGLPWLERAIIFSDNGAGTSCTVHWGTLDGKLIEWCYGDEGEYAALEYDLFEVWKREQQKWDSLDDK